MRIQCDQKVSINCKDIQCQRLLQNMFSSLKDKNLNVRKWEKSYSDPQTMYSSLKDINLIVSNGENNTWWRTVLMGTDSKMGIDTANFEPFLSQKLSHYLNLINRSIL